MLNTILQLITLLPISILTFALYRLTKFIMDQEAKYSGTIDLKEGGLLKSKKVDISNLEIEAGGKMRAVNIEPETAEQKRKRLEYEAMDETQKRLHDVGYDPTKLQPTFVESTKEKIKRLMQNMKGRA